jgi:hypothetical protein
MGTQRNIKKIKMDQIKQDWLRLVSRTALDG